MLTPKQKQTLELIASGNLSKEAAKSMCVSVRTIETHLSLARESLEAKTTAQAVAIAIRRGIILSLAFVCLSNALNTNYSLDMRRPVRTSVRVVRTIRNRENA
jgi:DNA-binding CsgD family transcriptional regulator